MRASLLRYAQWLNSCNGVKTVLLRYKPLMIFVEANITRASGGVGPLPHKSGSPQGVHVRDVPDRPSHPVNGDGSPERNFDDESC